MPNKILDYRRPIRVTPGLPWYRSDLVAACGMVGIILLVNGFMLDMADRDLYLLWIIFYIPLVNGALASVLLFCSPIFRAISGMSASLHVWVTLIGCAAAIVIDIAIFFAI